MEIQPLDRLECGICGMRGQKIPHEGSHFCSEEHVRLFDRKMKEADMRIDLIENCSICGKPVENSKWSNVNTSVNVDEDFKAFRFCSESCFEQWP
jgi:hypothetical protein